MYREQYWPLWQEVPGTQGWEQIAKGGEDGRAVTEFLGPPVAKRSDSCVYISGAAGHSGKLLHVVG